jgi:dihydroxyacetone kinase-like protein
MVTAQTLNRWLAALTQQFAQQEDYLNQLDGQAGDGDHGTTLLRGLTAAAQTLADPLEPGPQLTAFGAALRRSAGGASGPLFASLFLEMGKVATTDGLSLEQLAEALEKTAQTITRLGKAQVGDRTLLDALVPAAQALRSGGGLPGMVQAAQQGLQATATMLARKGRAQYVNQGQVNSPDAGAQSLTLMLQELLEASQP